MRASGHARDFAHLLISKAKLRFELTAFVLTRDREADSFPINPFSTAKTDGKDIRNEREIKNASSV